LVQVTRVPTLIVIVDGENEKSWIVTQSLEQLGDVELLQATETAETPTNTTRGNHIGPPLRVIHEPLCLLKETQPVGETDALREEQGHFAKA